MWSTPEQRPDSIDSTRLARDRGRRFVASAAAAIVARGAGPLLSLAVTPYALSKLGAEQFGLFVLALTASSWLALFDPGLAAGLRIVLARRSSRLDSPEVAPLLGAAKAGQDALAAITLVAGGALAAFAAPWLGVPSELHEQARILLLLMAAGAAVSVTGRRFGAALDACQWSSAERGARLAQSLLRAALLALFLWLDMGLRAAGWSYLIACIAGAAGLAAASRRLLPELRWNTGSGTRKAFRELVTPGLWLSLGAAAGVLIAGVDRAVVARSVSLEAVTVFALSGATYLLVETMLTSVVDAARPALAQALGSGKRDEAAKLYLGLAQATAVAAPAAALTIAAINRAFVTAWAGAEAYGGWRLDLWFGLALVANLWSLPHRAFLSADLEMRHPTMLRLGEGALNLALSVGLASRYGIAGVAAGTVVASALTSLWALPLLGSRASGIPVRELMAAFLRGPAVVAALAPAALAIRSLAEDSVYLGAALAGVMAVAGIFIWRRSIVHEARTAWQTSG